MDEKTSNKLYDEVTRLSEDEEYYGIYTELSHHEMLLNTIKEEVRLTEKADIAKKMLLIPNITTEQIAEITGLTAEKVQEIQKEVA